MNSYVIALQRRLVAGAVVGVLLGLSAVPSLAHSATSRPAAARSAATQRSRAQRHDRSPLVGSGASAHASIVDGTLASIAEFPFQVALYDPRLGSPAKGFFRGGVTG